MFWQMTYSYKHGHVMIDIKTQREFLKLICNCIENIFSLQINALRV